MPPATDNSARLYFLDWVRIAAFFVLILYHVGMYYVTWGWHVKSEFASDTAESYMMLSAPWRLGLLFLISGAASRCMLASTAAGAFMRQRSWRLLLPLLFGMLVIVPPQPYFEVVEKYAYQGSYADFMQLYLHGYRGFADGAGKHLVLPTWNHLWFVAYLWAYTMLLAALVAAGGRRFDAVSQRAGRLLTGWKAMLLPAAVLAMARVLLHPLFPQTHDLVHDWYNHANYFFLFMAGALLAREGAFWARLEALRWSGLAIALACWALLKICFSLPDGLVPEAHWQWLNPVHRAGWGLFQWSAIVAVCGFAHRHLHFDSPGRRYLAQAVFPVYIVHQTLIVAMAHALKPLRLAPGIEAILLAVLTVTASFAIFEAVRRCAPLRPLFGLGGAAGPAARNNKGQPAHA
ncbi:MAG: acyltransferase family protein [Pseudomonadota bacterium]